MYKKLLKNFIGKNMNVFLLIFFSLSISLFGYIFSDSLSKNFLDNLSKDSQSNLGGDIVVDIGSKPESYFYDNLRSLLNDKNIEIATQYSLASSFENGSIISSNIIYFSSNFPFYGDFSYTKTGFSSGVIISQDLYDSLPPHKTIGLFGDTYNIYGWYKELPKSLNSILSTENIFFEQQHLSHSILDDSNAFIDKKFFFKIHDPYIYDDVILKLESVFTPREVQGYKNGGERFKDIILNLKNYINYIVLFSLFLTVTIIFLSVSVFFIQERKQLSILRILGMDNIRIILFFGGVFLSIFLFSYLTALTINIIIFELLQNFDLTQNFRLMYISIIKGIILGVVLFLFSFFIPIYKLLQGVPNIGLQDNFFNHLEKKEKYLLFVIFFILIIFLSLFLGYGYKLSVYIAIIITILGFLFGYLTSVILKLIYKKSIGLKREHFFLYDAIRSTIRPGNLSFLLNISFFIIFFIIFFISILFGNFYNRLQINFQTDSNVFILNLTEDVFQKIDQKYQNKSFSLLKGRIISINNKTLQEHLGNKVSGRFSREFNITDSGLENLRIIKGKPLDTGGISIDYNFSQDLGVQLGDEIVFQIYGIEKKLIISNIRESQDYSINPFFYFQVYKQDFENFPKQYFISDYIHPGNMEDIKKYFYHISQGTVNFIEVDSLLVEIKDISKKIFLIIQILFFYIIVFCITSIGVVGLYYQQFQEKKSYLYFLLGAQEKENKKRIFYEYVFLSTFMLLLSILIVTIGSYYLIGMNDFLSFDFFIYYISLGIIFVIYLILLFFIYTFFLKHT